MQSKANPFSYTNIQKAQSTLATSMAQTNAPARLSPDRLYTYLKFDPNTITGDMLKELEKDTTAKILDFPFANGEMYTETFALDENKAKQLADGNLYAVVKKDAATETMLKGRGINAVVLNELYLPNETDTALQYQALRQVGYSEAQIDALRVCLLKRPQGFVRYQDTETGNLRGVKGMQVWALVFGIPLHTYTNSDGFYNFPWRFSVGTIMGTHAKNLRVNIKPFNTQGAWLATLPIQFIVGSIHIQGWVGSCAMRSDVNFDFTEHKQNRFWAQMMDGVKLHDEYTEADGILRAPYALTMYAHWADRGGNSSAPMLGHLSGTNLATIALQYLADLLGLQSPNDLPNLMSLLYGIAPDITVRTNGTTERASYSANLMQTVLHELSHGSHFQRAGQIYWYDLIRASIRRHPDDQCGGGYGCGQNPDDGNVAIAESWAEFLGTNYAIRVHPTGSKLSKWAGSAPPTFASALIQNSVALEQEPWFFNDWIASGIYNDLMDRVNTDLSEDWDRTGGLTIKQLYEALGPNIDTFCKYEGQILSRYGLNATDVDLIFFRNRAGACL
jgi:hypothetical protein